MTEPQLRTTVYDLGFQPPQFVTSWGSYAHPTPAWLRKMADWLKAAAIALGIARYAIGSRNCKVYSLWAKAMMELAHGRDTEEPKQAAIGACYFTHRSGERHAALLVIHNRKSWTVFDLTFLLNGEPPIYKLNPAEIASCDWLYF